MSATEKARRLAALAADERTPEHERAAAAMALAKLVVNKPETIQADERPQSPFRPWVPRVTDLDLRQRDREDEAREQAREDARRKYVDVDPGKVRETLRRAAGR